MCERVITPACQAPATTTVPMFMGSIKVCDQCRLELTAEATPAPVAIVTGDYVYLTTLKCAGIVKQVLGNGEYVVEWAYTRMVDGVSRMVEGRGVLPAGILTLA